MSDGETRIGIDQEHGGGGRLESTRVLAEDGAGGSRIGHGGCGGARHGTDRNIYDFESKVLPECCKRNAGVVAMKVYAGIKGGFPNHRRGWVGCNTSPERLSKAMVYALDLEGVHVANVGPFTMEQPIENVELARRYKPLTAGEREELLAFGREPAPTLGPRYGPVA